MSLYQRIFPPPDDAVEMEPEELAMFLLKLLNEQTNINRHNLTLGTNHDYVAYVGGVGSPHYKNMLERIMEAWMWLERELLIAPKPGQMDGWSFITRKGHALLKSQDFSSYRSEKHLSADTLDPVFIRKVKPPFIRGDYESAIFEAFKEVEVRVRDKAGYGSSEYGVPMLRKAFGKGGPLCDTTIDGGEQVAMMELFSGALGTYKNPTSHRRIAYNDPKEAAEIIHIANQLIRMLER